MELKTRNKFDDQETQQWKINENIAFKNMLQ